MQARSYSAGTAQSTPRAVGQRREEGIGSAVLAASSEGGHGHLAGHDPEREPLIPSSE